MDEYAASLTRAFCNRCIEMQRRRVEGLRRFTIEVSEESLTRKNERTLQYRRAGVRPDSVPHTAGLASGFCHKSRGALRAARVGRAQRLRGIEDHHSIRCEGIEAGARDVGFKFDGIEWAFVDLAPNSVAVQQYLQDGYELLRGGVAQQCPLQHGPVRGSCQPFAGHQEPAVVEIE